jgi:hypothetical protein
VRGLFSRPDLVPYMYNNRESPDLPSGHVTFSRGFKLKISDNPHMNCDQRNIGLVGTTDGIPYFDDQKRGAWPFILRVANLPDGLSTHVSNTHLHLLSASEHWELDEAANVLRRRVRAPKSLHPLISIIVDDLLAAYKRGSAKSEEAYVINVDIFYNMFTLSNICRLFLRCVDICVRDQRRGCQRAGWRPGPDIPRACLPSVLDGGLPGSGSCVWDAQ